MGLAPADNRKAEDIVKDMDPKEREAWNKFYDAQKGNIDIKDPKATDNLAKSFDETYRKEQALKHVDALPKVPGISGGDLAHGSNSMKDVNLPPDKKSTGQVR